MTQASAKDVAALHATGHFDAEWYRRTFPDVDAVGMDPALHYLRYGNQMNRDPGPDFSTRFTRVAYKIREDHEPITRLAWMQRRSESRLQPDPKRVLKAASLVAETGEHDRAVALAEAHLPADLAYTANILRANAAIARADETTWLRHVNAYLAAFDLAPVQLQGAGTLFKRLRTAPLPPVTGGPMVTVIMPAWNSEDTVRHAAQSILNQTWRNLELLIVDDCSTDGTWAVLQQIAANDDRVKIRRNKVNVGPYVSKNIALTMAQGDYVAGHDADDWAHPQRIRNHVTAAEERNLDASLAYMIRMKPSGVFGHLGNVGGFSMDAVARKASISCLFKRSALNQKLGFWDSVRFGADSEMIARAAANLDDRFAVLPQISMICLDLETSLTNHPVHGVDKSKGISPIRANYHAAWGSWVNENKDADSVFLPLIQETRRYAAAKEMVVSHLDVRENLKDAVNVD